MAKLSHLFSSLLLVFTAGCKESCINRGELDALTAELKPWVVKAPDSPALFTDSGRIESSVTASGYIETDYPQILEDDCGNTYGTFYRDLYYRSEIENFGLSVQAHGFSYGGGEGFRLNFGYRNTSAPNGNEHSAWYDFDQPPGKGTQLLDSCMIGSVLYRNVIKITFPECTAASDIRTFYFVKGDGLRGFETVSGRMVYFTKYQ